jgi:ubiquinone/menaquinone biosynthesis C-methylase UbiE
MERRHGYDAGYRAVGQFWPRQPGSLVKKLVEEMHIVPSRALDLGCGEGNNAAYLAAYGADVVAVDISALALANAVDRDDRRITWIQKDVMNVVQPDSSFDCIVAYGLLHCLRNVEECHELLARSFRWLMPGGYIACVCFNDRRHRRFAEAHPGFSPLLLPHQTLKDMFRQFRISIATDSDLIEAHPDLDIAHSHSMTRILAAKP